MIRSTCLVAAFAALLGGLMPAAGAGGMPGEPTDFAALPGFAEDDLAAALVAFRTSCAAPPAIRAALPKPSTLAAICADALALPASPDRAAARAFFEAHFAARRVGAPGAAFFTGYYEPVVDGSLDRSEEFSAPLYGVPNAKVTPMPDRAAIDAGALHEPPLVYLREPVEAFFVQIQGSARIRLPDGTLRRLVYAGRNGFPYTSIGKILVDTLHIPPAEMGMSQLKAWIRANGQKPGEAGLTLMQRNRSTIFFRFDDALPSEAGPVGGEGISLTTLRSLAIDRAAWPYGLPFYIDATLPWAGAEATPFRRLMIGQDTGSAIVGTARGDIFLGTGDEAARRAGAIRDHGSLYVLWPKDRDAGPR